MGCNPSKSPDLKRSGRCASCFCFTRFYAGSRVLTDIVRIKLSLQCGRRALFYFVPRNEIDCSFRRGWGVTTY